MKTRPWSFDAGPTFLRLNLFLNPIYKVNYYRYKKMEEEYGGGGSINHLQLVHHETFKPVRGYW